MHTYQPPTPTTPRLYLLFVHEPYWPPQGTTEVNATIVAAATLLHPRVLQPDGLRIHDLLSSGQRKRGEIVPMATLTAELGDTGWRNVAAWERVAVDLLTLSRFGDCHALSVALPAVDRALLCNGPDVTINSFDSASGNCEVHGPADRESLLRTLTEWLRQAEAERPLWPGDTLLPKPHPGTQDEA
ncbi:hypothetical protein [Streptomyces flavofungini]|uniref:Uncharacterized protein n=1 Tax=Streptomyces flavofungini TaxID=68200 RepID=A0ABS0XGJ7_9ACTN|nr:hypothetical protein [Streptomyces flavofungini]MBJ3812327.1 hypothetical protein [Streptomyces flavofungini]GHC88418.1 hypothetical protein GCM10010349_75690 [Streptomyces flavofungini]